MFLLVDEKQPFLNIVLFGSANENAFRVLILMAGPFERFERTRFSLQFTFRDSVTTVIKFVGLIKSPLDFYRKQTDIFFSDIYIWGYMCMFGDAHVSTRMLNSKIISFSRKFY